MPSIDRRSHASGLVTYRVRWTTAGGGRRSRSFNRKSDAQVFIRALERERAGGRFFDPRAGEQTLRSFVEQRWLPTRVALAPKTVAEDESFWRCHIAPAFAEAALRSITRADVDLFVRRLLSKPLSPSRVSRIVQRLGHMLRLAMADDLINADPTVGVKVARGQDPHPVIPNTIQAEAAIRSVPRFEDRLLLRVLAYGGLRWSEAAGLQRRHVNPFKRTITVEETLSEVSGKLHEHRPTKTRSRRTIPLPRFVAEDLARHLDRRGLNPDEYVFVGPRGGLMRNSTFRSRVWDPARSRAGIPEVTLHCLRHHAASVLFARRIPVTDVSRILGHRDVATTMKIYAHCFEEDLGRAADALDAAYGEASDALDAAYEEAVVHERSMTGETEVPSEPEQAG